MSSFGALRPMGLFEIIDQAFRLYRRNFWLFFGIAAVAYVPFGVLQTNPAVAVVAGLLLIPVAQLVSGALTKAVSDRYMGEAATVGSAYGHLGKRLVPFVLTLFVAYLFVGLGAFLLGVGLIVFLIWATFVMQVFIIEDKRYLAAVWRSRFLIGQGVWASAIALGLITGVLTLLIQSALTAPFGVNPFGGPAVQAGLGMGRWIAVGLVTGISQALTVPIGLVATVLLYYDSRIRKEGFDLEVLARELGKPQRAAAPESPAPQPASPEPPAPSPPMDEGTA